MANYGWLYALISLYGVASGAAATFAHRRNKAAANDAGDAMRNHFGGGKGLGGVALFFTLWRRCFRRIPWKGSRGRRGLRDGSPRDGFQRASGCTWDF